MARVTWSMAPLAQAAALLNLGVAEGAAGAVVTVQSHVPLRGLQLLTAFTLVFHGVGLQGVPVGRSAQRPAAAVPSSRGLCHPVFKTLSLSFASSLGAKVSATAALGHQVSYVCSQMHSRSLLWGSGFCTSEILPQTEILLQK